MEKIINWGILGCGDVAENKSGPAFGKAAHSHLLAVMRRNGEKARDFARRHRVPHWYDNVGELLENPNVDAVYIATPPSSHLELALKAMEAGKHVYLEKPMTMDHRQAKTLVQTLKESGVKLTIAHYRRKMPAFLKVKELLDQNAIGDIRFVDIHILQPHKSGIIAETAVNWRVDPSISGGGYFHDLAPHQIDLMCHYFGDIVQAHGLATNQGKQYDAPDLVQGIASFANGVQFRGVWSFNVPKNRARDLCIIYGSRGSLEFSFYGDKITFGTDKNTEEVFNFAPLEHVQQPMIEATTAYFLGKGPNPCTAEEGLEVMKLMDVFVNKHRTACPSSK